MEMREQRRRHPQRALHHRARLQRPRLPLLHNLHAAACAVLCGGNTHGLAHSLSARGGERNRVARQHGMRTARSSAVAACSPERTLPTARPPSCTAHPAPASWFWPVPLPQARSRVPVRCICFA
eukprot:scaffold14576_cov132-Isochrysis_galbana.AAC.17